MTASSNPAAGGQSELSGKVAIVTGASRGIGRAIAIDLARRGASVVLTARDETALRDASDAINATGSRAAIVAGDLTSTDFAQRVVSTASDTFGAIDMVVNNAGATKRGNFVELSEDDWQSGFALKFFGAVRVCRAAWPQLKARRGSVINIAGSGGRQPDALFTIGGSVNAAMLSFTKALAELGLEDGVQVNAINPGLIRTDRLRKRIEDAISLLKVDKAEAERRMIKQFNITRIGEPEEIAALVAFILSPPGRQLHGALIDADAGYTKGV